MRQMASGSLPAAITVASANIPASALTQDKFKDGNLPDGSDDSGAVVTVTAASIGPKTINPAKLADGALTTQTMVNNQNVPANTVPASTYVYMHLAQHVVYGPWPTIRCVSAQVRGLVSWLLVALSIKLHVSAGCKRASRTHETKPCCPCPYLINPCPRMQLTSCLPLHIRRLTCDNMNTQDFTKCLRVTPQNLVCPDGSAEGSVPLPSCVTISGTQVTGDMDASQVSCCYGSH